ncbi:MAG TPA: hypothetical protein VFG47_19325, partial [Geminicoccaceae bacterium]|nr:hypothetical protein [Geminicoccaceae bacterium]
MGDDQRGIHWDVPREEGFAGRTEALTGATGRRRWPDEVRVRIVADVARLHGTRRAGGSTIGASSPGGGVLARLDPFRGEMFVFPSRR